MSDEENKDETTSTEPESGASENTKAQSDTVSVEDIVGDNGSDEAGSGDDARPDLGLILDIPVTLSLELGSTTINLGDLLKLNKGSVVALEKEASEPLDVKVNGTLIAFAEVVVINDRYGIRLIDVVSESERLKKLS
ncbi:MAG: flagellar motor switch protein FliN [Oceanospirillales bacterium LUC14_002_19_P2]|nr:MAG: flagellar motor switch protein FliN [Oceanospirillales bacterium LUC14_002_19_P2]